MFPFGAITNVLRLGKNLPAAPYCSDTDLS